MTLRDAAVGSTVVVSKITGDAVQFMGCTKITENFTDKTTHMLEGLQVSGYKLRVTKDKTCNWRTCNL